jgi:two-component system C4-dicarboxylate transport response regulator DctD
MKNPNEGSPENRKPEKPYGGLTFVVADDQLAVKEALTNYLSELGADVVGCGNAQQCFAAVRVLHPDLLLVDLKMPGRGGLELMTDVRSLSPDEEARVPAIALTFYASDEVHARALGAGFQALLVKPFNASALVGTSNRVLDKAAAG